MAGWLVEFYFSSPAHHPVRTSVHKHAHKSRVMKESCHRQQYGYCAVKEGTKWRKGRCWNCKGLIPVIKTLSPISPMLSPIVIIVVGRFVLHGRCNKIIILANIGNGQGFNLLNIAGSCIFVPEKQQQLWSKCCSALESSPNRAND